MSDNVEELYTVPSILSAEQVEKIAEACMNDDNECSKDDFETITGYFEQVMIDHSLLMNVIDGNMKVSINPNHSEDGEELLMFDFTDKGFEAVQEYADDNPNHAKKMSKLLGSMVRNDTVTDA